MPLNTKSESSEYWVSMSDMMAGLMLIFLLIAIAYMSKISTENEQFTDIVKTYNELKIELYNELVKEFNEDLIVWNANIDPELLSISFNEPDVLFAKGKVDIQPYFKVILDDFFPRYLEILFQKKFVNNISEIRIEGHTSSEWREETSSNLAYIFNMNLSQNRTANVLDYVLKMRKVIKYSYLRNKILSVGYSSSKLKYDNDIEDKESSRRVEFRVITDAEKKIEEILNIKGYNNQININQNINQEDAQKKRLELKNKAREIEIADSIKNIEKIKEEEVFREEQRIKRVEEKESQKKWWQIFN